MSLSPTDKILVILMDLTADVTQAEKDVAAATTPHMVHYTRRALVRCVCAYVEAALFWMRQLMLLDEAPFSAEEVLALRESTIQLDSNGAVKILALKPTLRDSLRFTFAMFRKMSKQPALDFSANGVGGSGWSQLMETFALRDQLMHPKSLEALRVTEDQTLRVQAAHVWFREISGDVIKAWVESPTT